MNHEEDEEQYESWDEFWSSVNAKPETEKIRGVKVIVPNNLPLNFQDRFRELEDSEDEEDVQALVAELFGDDVMDAWRDAGMGAVEFQVALAWGLARGQGDKISFREAYEKVEQAKKLERPQPNRAERRAQSKSTKSTASKNSGSRSSRTSAANTKSGRKK